MQPWLHWNCLTDSDLDATPGRWETGGLERLHWISVAELELGLLWHWFHGLDSCVLNQSAHQPDHFPIQMRTAHQRWEGSGGNTAFSLCCLFCLLSAHSQGGAQAWSFYTLEQSLSIRSGMEAVSGYLKGFGSPKRLYLWACQKVRGEGWDLVFQRGGNPGAQTWSWPCFHSLLSFTSLSQHTQFTLWYPAHVDFGWGYPPELRIYDRANRHPSKE